jgi:glycosyltransferase involved in cell wall biosynthesis
MTRIIVQIPCLNEAETLPQTIADIPRTIEGASSVEILVIDDGSTDDTAEVARACGADHVLVNRGNKGLAFSFQAGLDHALSLGADIIVNTDGDNQYRGADIARLVAPILAGEADLVVGDRGTQDIAHFSPLKKFLQRAGTGFVGRLAGAEVADAVSGFRAISADAARKLTVRSTFSYTTETLIQAGKKNLTIKSVPVRTNAVTRPSRLFRSIPQFLFRSGRTMLRAWAMYEPLRIFLGIGLVLMALGALPILRFVWNYFAGDGTGMVQSLVLGGVLILMGGLSAMFALIADLVAYNRQIAELTLERVRKIENRLGQAQAGFPEADLRRELDVLRQRTAAAKSA